MNCPLEVPVSLQFTLRCLTFKCLKLGEMNLTSNHLDLALFLHLTVEQILVTGNP